MSATLLGNIVYGKNDLLYLWTERTVNELERHGGKLWLGSFLRNYDSWNWTYPMREQGSKLVP